MCFFGTKPSWITSPKLITMFRLFIHISYAEELREGLIQLLIICSGDIEVNLGPKIRSPLLFCHWNLNSLSAHNFVKVLVLQALPVTHDYYIICLSETFLDSSVSNDNERIRIEGYNLLRADHPSNKKRGGVCMYYKEHLPITKRDDLCTLKENHVTKIVVGKKKVIFFVFI